MVLFNEIEPFAADWLRAMYGDAHIDTRSIADLQPADIAGFRRVHFFAGIGGWEEALRIAGWPKEREIWTGSAPCQPFSVAGKRGGTADERHLWPQMFRLIRECRPETAMGEQVSSKDGLLWLDGVFDDLEAEGYTCWAVDTCAAGVGAPHIRQRLYWVAYAAEARYARAGGGEAANGNRADSLPQRGVAFAESAGSGEADGLANAGGKRTRRNARTASGEKAGGGRSRRANGGDRSNEPISCGSTHRLEHAASDGRQQGRAEPSGRGAASGCGVGGLGQPNSAGREPRKPSAEAARYGNTAFTAGDWSNAAIIHCRDGKSRPISAESGDEPLAYGIPLKAGHIVARLGELGVNPKTAKRIIANARRNRTGRLRGYGNAIVPQVAVEFVKSVMEAMA